MNKKLISTIIVSALLLLITSALAYPNNLPQKTKIPPRLLKQLIIEKNQEYYAQYKRNKNKINTLFEARKVDLNNDKKDDYLIIGNFLGACGSGGCVFWIYCKTPNTEKYRSLEPLSGNSVMLQDLEADSISVMNTTTNGFFDLECTVGSYGDRNRVVLKFNGTRYARASKDK